MTPRATIGSRCPCCGGRVSARCGICRGTPDGTSIEELARGVAQVDRAWRGWLELRPLAPVSSRGTAAVA